MASGGKKNVPLDRKRLLLMDIHRWSEAETCLLSYKQGLFRQTCAKVRAVLSNMVALAPCGY